MEEFCGSDFWDPALTWTTTDPDFTLCFKLTVLIWVPCGFLWLLSPLDIFYMKMSTFREIPWSYLCTAKLITIILLMGISLLDFIMSLVMMHLDEVYEAHIVAAIIKFITFTIAGILTLFHRKYGIQSSGTLFLFWFILCVFAIPQYRSEIRNFSGMNTESEEFVWTDYQFVSYMIYYPLTVIILILCCFADKTPTVQLHRKVEKPNPELSASFLRQLFFQYFDREVWTGYRRPLEIEDMYDINPDSTSEAIDPVFARYWMENVMKEEKRKIKNGIKSNEKFDKETNRNIRETNGSILMPMVKAFGPPFWFAGILKLIMDLLGFASPQILSLLISFTFNDEAQWKGLLYAFTLFLLSILTSILNGQYFLRSFLVGFRIRSALINAIYRKALKISSFAKKTTTVGEIVNLMAVDAQRFFELMAYLHMIWSGPLVIALSIYFLYAILGPSVFVGLGVMILLIPLNGFIATKMRTFQIKQMEKKDERVKLMNEVLSGIKVLKLYAWEESFQNTVQDVRDKEMKIIKDIAFFNAGTHFLWTMTPFLVSLASFATFVLIDENNVLDANVAFVSLSLFNILRMPMTMFPMMIAFIMQAWVSITRINSFLNKEELDPDCVTHEKTDHALSIDNGTFSWGEKDILNNINLKVKTGELVAIVGPVGCGKSSLISALLGEMEKIEGKVNTYGNIAFVPQQAWIQNATLRENILFGKEFKQKTYDTVVAACALTSDLEMLPGGDQTEIGEKGINLSGGQKQRVSLARAVYSNADIYLLDDPLSAVDAHVGKHIFENVIGPTGLLAGKTIFLVTHAISYLPKVDNIFVVSNGEITESGTYNKLIEQKGAFADFIVQHLQDIDDEEELEEIKQVLSDKPIFDRAISLRSSNSEKKVANGVGHHKTKSITSDKEIIKDVKPQEDMAKLIHSEDSATGSVSIGVYIRYFKSIGWTIMFITLATGIINQALSVYSNTWLSDWAADPNNTVPHVRDMYLGVYGALGVGQAIALFASSIVLALGCIYAARDLHNKLLKHSFRLPMSFFDTTPLGRIMNRFSKDVDMVDNILPMSIRAWLLMFFGVIAIFVVISISTPIFVSVIIPIAILYYLIQKFYIATSRQLKRIESITRSPIYSHFGESITGQSSIRAYGAQSRFTIDSTKKVDFNQKCTYPSIIANRWLGVRLEIVGSLVILFAALFAVLGRETLTGAIVGLSVSYALQITQILSFLVRMTAEVETNIVAIERIEEYANLPTEAPLLTKQMDPLWPQNGEVIFDGLKVRYREGLELVLKGISFQVHGGEKVGIVGRTGAGKSSLTVALFRLIEADSGKIVIDNVNIADMGLYSLRSRLTIIPQDPVLFSGTVRKNVDPFETYTDDEIWLALHHAHLKAYVKGLPDGLQHLVSESGENLSVGQRQLICLARALLRKTKILILDEATAAIDLETDDLIQKTIRSQFADCTILTIAHRLNTILDSDRVLVLDKGYIAEYDSPANLLDNRDSIFYGMAKSAGVVS